MPHFAAGLARTEDHWTGEEVDLDDVEDLEAVADLLRELTGDGPGPALLLLEQDEEWLAIVRVDGGTAALGEPKVFLSDARATIGSELAQMLWEDTPDAAAGADGDADEEEGTKPVAEPVGEAGLLADLGTSAAELLELCAEEGLLPADVLTAVAERAGCAAVLERVRE